MTERLYDREGKLFEFEAEVLSVEPCELGYKVVLDRTAFFPGGGGQAADTGHIDGIDVSHVAEEGNDIVHVLEYAPTHKRVQCKIDGKRRYKFMQMHTGEHIFSGTVYKLFGIRNVGFHMSDEDMTLDFSEELSAEQIDMAEQSANDTVMANESVKSEYYEGERLAALSYRSKKEIEGAVRIVQTGTADVCACCAPNVEYTGEVGMIKVLSAQRHRGGVRLVLVSGRAALDDYREKCENLREISQALSAKPNEAATAFRRYMQTVERERRSYHKIKQELLMLKCASLTQVEGSRTLFESEQSIDDLRAYVNAAMPMTSCVVAAFTGEEGDYTYVIGSEGVDLKKRAVEINTAIDGRGGGTARMISGRAKANRADIEIFFNNMK